MSVFKGKKQDENPDEGTWGQVFADMRNVLGISRTSDVEAKSDTESSREVAEVRPREVHIDPGVRLEEREETAAALPASDVVMPDTRMGKVRALWRRFAGLSWRKKALIGVGVLALMVAGVFRDEIFAPWPPAPDVVATFNGGQITLDDVRKHLASLGADETAQEALATPRGYAFMVEEMITDELVRRWSENRNPESDKTFSHVMKHITEEVNLDQLHAEMHKGQLGVTESDIQAYYEANRKTFGEKTLTDVRDEIKTTLQGGKEDEFVKNYITALKNKASITRDFAVLNVPEPTERDLSEYFNANKQEFVRVAQARVQVIRIPKESDEKSARVKADQALVAIRSGSSFAAAAKGAGVTLRDETVVKENKNPAYEETVFRLNVGSVSDVIGTSDAFVIAKLVSKEPERPARFDEVRTQILPSVRAEKEKQYFADRADRTLFTVNGTRFTAGEFWSEYQELSASFLRSYQGTKGKQELVERIIERALLFQDSVSQVSQSDTKEKKDEMRLKVLAQMMEQEEVDEKITVEDAEIQKFYDENADKFQKPPRSKIRHIAISMGTTDEEYQRAAERAEEAYKKLVPGFLKKGADFASVAREYSDDEATKNSGGEMNDWIEEDESEMADMHGMGGTHDMGGNMAMHEMSDHGFYEQILAIEKGEIGQPFAAEGFIHIVEVTDRVSAETIPLTDVSEMIKEVLKREKHDELALDLSRKLLEDADVTIYERTLKKLPGGP